MMADEVVYPMNWVKSTTAIAANRYHDKILSIKKGLWLTPCASYLFSIISTGHLGQTTLLT